MNIPTVFNTEFNSILSTDSYKASHWLQYPPDTDGMYAYIESRGGQFSKTTFFGLQMFIKRYLTQPITTAMVDEAKAFYQMHGEPFNEAGWLRIIDVFNGYLPVRIRAVKEGSVVPTGNVLVTIESTDDQSPWLVSFLETMLLRAVWYPTTVATLSWHVRQDIWGYLNQTSDDPQGQIGFKLHDFGARGVSSGESAAIGGAAHLVNFMGSDTVEAVVAANRYYNTPMAAFSIPAAEHSTITSWGRENEVEAYRNMIRKFGGPGKLFAVVSDSYDIYNAVEKLWGTQLRDEVIQSQSILVVRPDSGKPVEVVMNTLRLLEAKFGSTTNSKGFRVLNHVRVIQGDGVNQTAIRGILMNMYYAGFSADNIAFGMGGGLLQQVNRDTQKFAMKTSAIRINGEWRDVFKDPVTDSGKTSKKGKVNLWVNSQGDFITDINPPDGFVDAMDVVFENGKLTREQSLEEIRNIAHV
jgi:nicotinamide phosphoribosyltransferase